MLCQLCNKNVALVSAKLGSSTIRICIPCAISVLEDDKNVQLELERRLSGQQEEEGKVEEED